MPKRQSVNISGFVHQNPIPNACRVGNLLMSGVIVGMDHGTRNLPPDIESQCANMFAHVRAVVEAGGGAVEDIVKMTVWLKDPSRREVLNQEWLKMFPDKASRPARHTMTMGPESPALIQCDVTAVISGK